MLLYVLNKFIHLIYETDRLTTYSQYRKNKMSSLAKKKSNVPWLKIM